MEFNMQDLKSVMLAVAVIVAHSIYRKYRRSSILIDIDNLKYEKERLGAMKQSSAEMSRSAFRSLFSICIMICFAQSLTLSIEIISSGISFKHIPLVVWVFGFALSITFWKRYDNLGNIDAATKRMNIKIEKLNNKLQ